MTMVMHHMTMAILHINMVMYHDNNKTTIATTVHTHLLCQESWPLTLSLVPSGLIPDELTVDVTSTLGMVQ